MDSGTKGWVWPLILGVALIIVLAVCIRLIVYTRGTKVESVLRGTVRPQPKTTVTVAPREELTSTELHELQETSFTVVA